MSWGTIFAPSNVKSWICHCSQLLVITRTGYNEQNLLALDARYSRYPLYYKFNNNLWPLLLFFFCNSFRKQNLVFLREVNSNSIFHKSQIWNLEIWFLFDIRHFDFERTNSNFQVCTSPPWAYARGMVGCYPPPPSPTTHKRGPKKQKIEK